MMQVGKIVQLTQAIRDYSECDLDFGTLRTLKMIDQESENLQAAIAQRDQTIEAQSEKIKQIEETTECCNCHIALEKTIEAQVRKIERLKNIIERADNILHMGNTVRERSAHEVLSELGCKWRLK